MSKFSEMKGLCLVNFWGSGYFIWVWKKISHEVQIFKIFKLKRANNWWTSRRVWRSWSGDKQQTTRKNRTGKSCDESDFFCVCWVIFILSYFHSSWSSRCSLPWSFVFYRVCVPSMISPSFPIPEALLAKASHFPNPHANFLKFSTSLSNTTLSKTDKV